MLKSSTVEPVDGVLNEYYYKKIPFIQLSLKNQQYYKQVFPYQILQYASCYNICNVFNEQGSLLLGN